MSLELNGSDRFGHVAASKLVGTRGLGFYTISARLDFVIQARSDGAALVDLVGNLFRRGERVGVLRPDNAVFVQAYERKSAQTQIELQMEVDHRRVARLDAARCGGGLDLELQLTGHVVDANGRVYRVWDRVDVSVSQSGWVDILRDIGFSERLLLEVPVIGERLESVAGPTIVAAAEAFQAGRWRDCVGKCRAALDGLTRALGDDGRSGPWGNKTMSKQERLLLIRQAL